jgi:predicted nucleic acid-binding protein
MVKALFDTNILIDYLNGVGAAKKELARYEYRAISAITWMEVLVGASGEEDAAIRAWLDTFDVVSTGSLAVACFAKYEGLSSRRAGCPRAIQNLGKLGQRQ